MRIAYLEFPRIVAGGVARCCARCSCAAPSCARRGRRGHCTDNDQVWVRSGPWIKSIKSSHYWVSLEQCGADVGDRSHKNGRVIARCDKPPALPINLGFGIDRADDDGTSSNNLRACNAALERIGD